MTTTDHLQHNKCLYDTFEDSRTSSTRKCNTNTRYKSFRQAIFTAGDEDQFRYHIRDRRHPDAARATDDDRPNIHASSIEKHVFSKYRNVSKTAVIDTFRYISSKFKKGIFVKITNNKLAVFLPFSKHGFVNEWGHRINPDLTKSYPNKGSKFVNSNIDEWYCNNYLVRNEFPISENDTNISIIKNMMEELCAHRRVPDTQFFINKRDFPVLSKYGFEPYGNIWGSDSHKLVSHDYATYTPIFSMSSNDNFADVLLPTYDDWSLIQQQQGKWFSDSTNYDIANMNKDWGSKRNVAVFRGTNTGEGVTTDTNPRLKASLMSTTMSHILDAGITKWNTRPRKVKNSNILQRVCIQTLGFGLVNPLSTREQSYYKYVLHIQGHVSAYRLSAELSMRSVILMVRCEWKCWYSHLLQPYVHYVPVKSDLGDLRDQIQWCIDHDSECNVIAGNALDFYDKYISKDSVLDYIQGVLVKLQSAANASPPTRSPRSILYDIQKDYLSTLPTKFPKTPYTGVCNPINCSRMDLSVLNALRYYLNYTHHHGHQLSYHKKDMVILAGYECFSKSTEDSSCHEEYTHECFVGITGVNKLLEFCPNFAFTFGCEGVNIIREYVEGMTLLEYLLSPDFNLVDLYGILRQVSYAVFIGQQYNGFCHNDLTPWNIIIRRYDSPVVIPYVIRGERVCVSCRYVPVIIDYGKSRIVHDNVIYTFIPDDFKLSPCKDMLVLSMTILKTLIGRHMSPEEVRFCLYLINFYTGTTYLPGKVNNMNKLKNIIRKHSRFAALTHDDKYELEHTNSLDFINYLQSYSIFTPDTPSPDTTTTESVAGGGMDEFYHIVSVDVTVYIEFYDRLYRAAVILSSTSTWTSYYTILHIYNTFQRRTRHTTLAASYVNPVYEILAGCRPPLLDLVSISNPEIRDEDIIDPDRRLTHIAATVMNELQAFTRCARDDDTTRLIDTYHINNTINTLFKIQG